MPLDRSKWKAAPLSTVSETVQQTKQYDTYFGGKGEYAQFWKQRDGITVKRVLPAHEPGDSPYVPMLTAMLKCEVDEKDKEGKVIGKKISNSSWRRFTVVIRTTSSKSTSSVSTNRLNSSRTKKNVLAS